MAPAQGQRECLDQRLVRHRRPRLPQRGRVAGRRENMAGVNMVLAYYPRNTHVPQDLYNPCLNSMNSAGTMFTPSMFSWARPGYIYIYIYYLFVYMYIYIYI